MSYFMQHDQPALIDVIDSFLAEKKIAPVTFGRNALNDPHFVRDLRNGRRLWPETEQKVLDFIANYVPPVDEARAA